MDKNRDDSKEGSVRQLIEELVLMQDDYIKMKYLQYKNAG